MTNRIRSDPNLKQTLLDISRELDIDKFIAAWNLDTSHIEGILAKIEHIEQWLDSVDVFAKPSKDRTECRLSTYFYCISPRKDIDTRKFRIINEPFFACVSENYFYSLHKYPMPLPYISKENATIRRLLGRSQLFYLQMIQGKYSISDIKQVPEVLNGRNLSQIFGTFMTHLLSSLVNAGNNLERVKNVLNRYGINWRESRKTIDTNLYEAYLYENTNPLATYNPEAVDSMYSLEIMDYINLLPDTELLKALKTPGDKEAPFRRSDIIQQLLVKFNNDGTLKLRPLRTNTN